MCYNNLYKELLSYCKNKLAVVKIGKIIVFVISPLLVEFIRLQNQSRVFFIIRDIHD